MLSETEWRILGRLNRSTQLSLCSVMGLFASPEAVEILRELESRADGFVSFGSKVAGRYHKKMVLNLPPILFDSQWANERNTAATEAAILIATGFLGSVYELLRHTHYSTTPSWQFFRFVRHACFHGNMFKLNPGEPKHRAEWRGFEITQDLNDTRLLYDFLAIGDIFLLTADVVAEIGPPAGKRTVWEPVAPEWRIIALTTK